jgi:hypothetical protein
MCCWCSPSTGSSADLQVRPWCGPGPLHTAMNESGYDSPESAAMEGFPPQYCHVVAARVDGDHACVLLDTGSPGQPYLYEIHCRCRNGRWCDDGSSNGSGWHQIGDDPELGTLTVWGDAPEGVSAVRVEFQAVIVDEPVRDGAYLFVWWRLPCPEEEWPRILAILTASGWKDSNEFELFSLVWRGKAL